MKTGPRGAAGAVRGLPDAPALHLRGGSVHPNKQTYDLSRGRKAKRGPSDVIGRRRVPASERRRPFPAETETGHRH